MIIWLYKDIVAAMPSVLVINYMLIILSSRTVHAAKYLVLNIRLTARGV